MRRLDWRARSFIRGLVELFFSNEALGGLLIAGLYASRPFAIPRTTLDK